MSTQRWLDTISSKVSPCLFSLTIQFGMYVEFTVPTTAKDALWVSPHTLVRKVRASSDSGSVFVCILELARCQFEGGPPHRGGFEDLR